MKLIKNLWHNVGRGMARLLPVLYAVAPAVACYLLTGHTLASAAVFWLVVLPVFIRRLSGRFNREKSVPGWGSFVTTHEESTALLAKQVENVSLDIETAINELIGEFMSISERTSAQGEELLKARENMDSVQVDNEAFSTEALLSKVRTLLNEIIEQLVWISENMMRVTYEIEDLQDSAKNIGGLMQQVDAISDKTNLLALNASIEAARAGEHGKGFMVVAEEVRKLAQQSSEFSESIQQDMAAIAKGLDKSFNSISDVVTKDMTPLLTHKATIEKLVSRLLDQKNEVANQLGNAGNYSKEISGNIFSIVQKLQFQDRTKQRLEHVAEPLREISGALGGFIVQGEASPRDEAFLKRLQTSYTMAEERDVHQTAEPASTGAAGNETTPFESQQAGPEEAQPAATKEKQPDQDDNIDLF